MVNKPGKRQEYAHMRVENGKGNSKAVSREVKPPTIYSKHSHTSTHFMCIQTKKEKENHHDIKPGFRYSSLLSVFHKTSGNLYPRPSIREVKLRKLPSRKPDRLTQQGYHFFLPRAVSDTSITPDYDIAPI
ncbi:hypothetical protein BDV06DRAFT_186629 [Aspergillus oleicola]